MDSRRNTEYEEEPIWDEELENIEGPLEKALKGFDPTKMPDPEHSCHRLRKRVKVKDGIADE